MSRLFRVGPRWREAALSLVCCRVDNYEWSRHRRQYEPVSAGRGRVLFAQERSAGPRTAANFLHRVEQANVLDRVDTSRRSGGARFLAGDHAARVRGANPVVDGWFSAVEKFWGEGGHVAESALERSAILPAVGRAEAAGAALGRTCRLTPSRPVS